MESTRTAPSPSLPTVLITGASSGIGLAFASHLAGSGWRVFGVSRSASTADLSPVHHTLPMNVDEDESVARSVGEILARAGRLDAAVNCAGWGLAGPLEETSIGEARALMETNLFGAMRVCRAVLPAMRAGGGGRIVNVGSLAGAIALPFEGVYSASKFALAGFTESLRMEVRPFGVRVSLIEPGDFRTGFTQARRTAEGAGQAESPYGPRFETALRGAERREKAGPHPDRIARLLERILRHPSPRLRYRIGPGSGAPALRGWLPSRLFEWATERFFFPER